MTKTLTSKLEQLIKQADEALPYEIFREAFPSSLKQMPAESTWAKIRSSLEKAGFGALYEEYRQSIEDEFAKKTEKRQRDRQAGHEEISKYITLLPILIC